VLGSNLTNEIVINLAVLVLDHMVARSSFFWSLIDCILCTQRVTRPRGGINEWLHWLPVSLHKKLDYLIKQIVLLTSRGKKLAPLPSENGGGRVGLLSVLEADANQIVAMARETYEKYISLPTFVYKTSVI
jgi:hypothetical protein